MKKKILDLMYRLTPKWFKEYIFDRLSCEYMEIQRLTDWHKARRAGWKKKDMGFWYADLERAKHTNFLGIETQ
jgi:hypothetical protein